MYNLDKENDFYSLIYFIIKLLMHKKITSRNFPIHFIFRKSNLMYSQVHESKALEINETMKNKAIKIIDFLNCTQTFKHLQQS